MIIIRLGAPLFSASFLLIAGLAWNAAPATAQLRTASTRSLNEFARCFVHAREDAAQPWSFVPNDRGGAFSDAGAVGVKAPYRLLVAEGRHGTFLRLSGSPGSAERDRLVADVNRCR